MFHYPDGPKSANAPEPEKRAGLADSGDDFAITPQHRAQYQRDGFLQVNDVLSSEELRRLRTAVATAVEQERPSAEDRAKAGPYSQLFIQRVNLWRRHANIREFVLNPRLANLAAQLSGGPVRVWHDQALFKEPTVGVRTPWHQDAVYWPHADRQRHITIWIALTAATTHNGCMAFMPGTQRLDSLPAIDLGNPRDIFDYAPEFRGAKPQVCELSAGSCTFHHGLTFHYAGPNKSAQMREAFAIIYMPADTIYTGAPHVVTDPLNLQPGTLLDGELFPRVSTL